MCRRKAYIHYSILNIIKQLILCELIHIRCIIVLEIIARNILMKTVL